MKISKEEEARPSEVLKSAPILWVILAQESVHAVSPMKIGLVPYLRDTSPKVTECSARAQPTQWGEASQGRVQTTSHLSAL